jgi:hypothetical protein
MGGGELVHDSANIPRVPPGGRENCASENTDVVWLGEGSGSADPRTDGAGFCSDRHVLEEVVRNRNDGLLNASVMCSDLDEKLI